MYMYAAFVFLAATCPLLITFVNSLDPVSGLDTDSVFKKLILKKKSADRNKSMKNYPACK